MSVLELAGHRFDLRRARSLARPVRFDEEDGPSLAFGIPRARARPFAAGGFVGAVAEGGSVNCKVLELCAHGVGTHTESAWHLVDGAPPPHEAAPRAPVLAQLLRVTPEVRGDDRVITAAQLTLAPGVEAVIVDAGTAGPWAGTNPPFFDEDAARKLRAAGVDHLLTELPSVDPESDGGRLVAHRAFFDLDDPGHARRTITELCDLAGAPEGLYALSLQLPALVTDAVPSRPILYERRTP